MGVDVDLQGFDLSAQFFDLPSVRESHFHKTGFRKGRFGKLRFATRLPALHVFTFSDGGDFGDVDIDAPPFRKADPSL